MKDLKKQSDKDLAKMLKEKRARLQEIRFQVAGARAADVKEQSNLRKDVARILTEMTLRTNHVAADK